MQHQYKTKMHSSKMRTDRCSGCRGGLHQGIPGQRPPPNIVTILKTLPSLAVGNHYSINQLLIFQKHISEYSFKDIKVPNINLYHIEIKGPFMWSKNKSKGEKKIIENVTNF